MHKYFSHNGTILPIEQAVVPIQRIEYTYGFGVYETLRVSKGSVLFLEEHCQRLMESAKIISLAHSFTPTFIQNSIKKLVKKNNIQICNVKILLIGGPTKAEATLDIVCLNPLFPDKKLYKNGTTCISYQYERDFPTAKTLNMLTSYLAYHKAKQSGAYDSLFVNRAGHITEGTRTNVFFIKGHTLISPKTKDILPGVTRHYVIKVARQQGFEVIEQNVKLSNIARYEGACLTGTSVKIMPIRSIDGHVWQTVPQPLFHLMSAFNDFMTRQ